MTTILQTINFKNSKIKLLLFSILLLAAMLIAGKALAENFLFKWGTQGAGPGQFQYPQGLALDSNSNVYVTDVLNHRIQKFDPNGTFLSQWGSSGSAAGQFNKPRGAHVNGSIIYVADSENYRIQKFDLSGNFLLQWGSCGTANGQFSPPFSPYGAGTCPGGGGPEDVATDSLGNVYVADRFGARIQKFDSNGTWLLSWAVTGGVVNPLANSVTLDSGDNVYVTENASRKILKYNSSGTFIQAWSANFISGAGTPYPLGVEIDGSNNVFVTGALGDLCAGCAHEVQKFSSSGVYLGSFGVKGTGDGQFYQPWGIDVNSQGKVYVADQINNRVQVFGPPPPPTLPATDDFVYVPNGSLSIVSKIKKSDNTVTTFPASPNAQGVAVDESSVWVTISSPPSVKRYFKSAGALIDTINVHGTPFGVATDDKSVWVTNRLPNVFKIDKATNVSTQVVSTGFGTETVGIAVDATHVWVAVRFGLIELPTQGSGKIFKINKTTNNVDAVYPMTPTNPGVFGIAVTNNFVWVTNDLSNKVTKLNKVTGVFDAMISVASPPAGITADNNSVWVALKQSNSVIRIDPATNAVVATVLVGTAPVGISMDATNVYVANGGGTTVSVIDKATNAVTATVNVGGTPVGLGDMTGHNFDQFFTVPHPDQDNDGVRDSIDTQPGVLSSTATEGGLTLEKYLADGVTPNTNPGLVMYDIPGTSKAAVAAVSAGGVVKATCPNNEEMTFPLDFGDSFTVSCGTISVYVTGGDVTAQYKNSTYSMPNGSSVQFSGGSTFNIGPTTIFITSAGNFPLAPASNPFTYSYWVEKPSGTTLMLNSVDFPQGQSTVGYVVGDNGTILKTSDGGNTWVSQTSPLSGTTEYAIDLYCVDINTCYAVGTSGNILKTTNGGATWTSQVSGTSWPIYEVFCPVDANTCYAAGYSGTALKTTNGGSTWTALTNVPYGASAFWGGIDCLDNNRCWLAGGPMDATTYAGLFAKTIDGGATWTGQTSNTPVTTWGASSETIDMIDANIGYSVGISWVTWDGVNGKAALFKTTNGGSTWTLTEMDTGKWFNGVRFVNPTTGYIVGGNEADSFGAVIKRTSDGGATWSAQVPPATDFIQAVDFPVPDKGFYATLGGKIGKYTGAPLGDADADGVLDNKIDGTAFDVLTTATTFDNVVDNYGRDGVQGTNGSMYVTKLKADGTTPELAPGLAIADAEDSPTGKKRVMAKSWNVGGKVKLECVAGGAPANNIVTLIMTPGDEAVAECSSMDVLVTETGSDGVVAAEYVGVTIGANKGGKFTATNGTITSVTDSITVTVNGQTQTLTQGQIYTVTVAASLPYSDDLELYTVDQPPPAPWQVTSGANTATIKSLASSIGSQTGNTLNLTPLYSPVTVGGSLYWQPKLALTILETGLLPDAEVSADVSAFGGGQGSGDAGLVLNYQDPGNFYAAAVNFNYWSQGLGTVTALNIYKVINGSATITASIPIGDITPYQGTKLVFKKNGSKLEAFFAGKYLPYQDPSPLPAGKVGLMAIATRDTSAGARFDNFSVQSSVPTVITETTNPATLPFTDNFSNILLSGVSINFGANSLNLAKPASWNVDGNVYGDQPWASSVWQVQTLTSSIGSQTGNTLNLTPLYSPVTVGGSLYWQPKLALTILETGLLPDAEVSADVSAFGGGQGSGDAGLVLNYQDPGNFYAAAVNFNYWSQGLGTVTALNIYKVINGSATITASIPIGDITPYQGTKLVFKKNGSKLEAFFAGKYLPYQDPSPLPAGKVGLMAIATRDTSAGGRFDNFSVALPPDTDGDGVFDYADKCPNTDPADTSPFELATGCKQKQVDLNLDGLCNQNLTFTTSLCAAVCATPPTGMISWWQGEGNANDAQGVNNGTPMNGATFALGKVGQAFSFDGIDDFVEVPASDNLQIASALTINAWVKPDALKDYAGVVSKNIAGLGEQYTYMAVVHGDSSLGMYSPSSNWQFSSPGVVPSGVWSHVAWVWDGSTVKFYVNGTLVGTNPMVILNNYLAHTVKLGRWYTLINTYVFDGLIDEVEVFNSAKSASEIQSIYAAGSAGTCKVAPVAITGTVTSTTITPAVRVTDSVDIYDSVTNVTYAILPGRSHDLNGVTIEAMDGWTAVAGLALLPGETKSMRLKKLDPSANTVCVVDTPGAVSVTTLNCGGTLVACDDRPVNGYTCVDEGAYLRASGLRNSLIQQWGLPVGITVENPQVVASGLTFDVNGVPEVPANQTLSLAGHAFYTGTVGPISTAGATAAVNVKNAANVIVASKAGLTNAQGNLLLGPLGPLPPGNYTADVGVNDFTFSGESSKAFKIKFVAGVDLVGSLSPAVWEPLEQTSVTITAEVANYGTDAAAVASIARVFLDGSAMPLQEQTINPLVSGAKQSFDVVLPSLPAGPHTVKLVVDATNVIVESAENNNEYTLALFYHVAGPELKAKSFGTAPGNIKVGDLAKLQVTVKNAGEVASLATNLSASLDGAAIGTAVVGALAPGAETLVEVALPNGVTYGVHKISFVIDPSNQVAEWNELNNSKEFSRKWHAVTPDLVAQITGIGTQVNVQQATLNVRVTNLEGGSAGPFSAQLFVDGVLAHTQSFTALTGFGNFSDYTVTLPASFGSHTATVVVDSGNQVVEFLETNNSHSRNFQVTSTPLPGANLQVTSGDIKLFVGASETTNIQPGAAGVIKVTAKNVGELSAFNVVISLKVNNQFIGSSAAVNLAVGASQTVNFNWTAPSTTGAVISEAQVSANSDVNLSNNLATRAFIVSTGPSVSWLSPLGGTTISGTKQLTVSASAGTTKVDFIAFKAGVPTAIGTVNTPVDGTWSITWNSTGLVPPGTSAPITLKALATGTGGLQGDASINVTVDNSALPDLTPTTISFSNTNPLPGATITITANVGNVGTGAASNVVVYFYDGDPDQAGSTLIGTANIPSIAVAGSAAASVNWTATTAGVHQIFVHADRPNNIAELNDTNNKLSAPITVSDDIDGDGVKNNVETALTGSQIGLTVNTTGITAGTLLGMLNADNSITFSGQSTDFGNTWTVTLPAGTVVPSATMTISSSNVGGNKQRIIVQGVTLPAGATKSIELKKNGKVCITDSPTAGAELTAGACTTDVSQYRVNLTCNAVAQSFTFPDGPRAFTCTQLNGNMRVDGLRYSVVDGFEDADNDNLDDAFDDCPAIAGSFGNLGCPNKAQALVTSMGAGATGGVTKQPVIGATVKLYNQNDLQLSCGLAPNPVNAQQINANCGAFVKNSRATVQSQLANKSGYGQANFGLTAGAYYVVSADTGGAVTGRPFDIAATESVKDVNMQYINTSRGKVGAKQTTFTGSLFDLYSPVSIDIPAGVTVSVPWVGETSDVSWTWQQAFGTVPTGCTVNPQTQSTNLSTTGVLQTVALSFDITCQSATTITTASSLLDKLWNWLVGKVLAQNTHSRKDFGISHRLIDNTATGKGRVQFLDEILPARVFETPAF